MWDEHVGDADGMLSVVPETRRDEQGARDEVSGYRGEVMHAVERGSGNGILQRMLHVQRM